MTLAEYLANVNAGQQSAATATTKRIWAYASTIGDHPTDFSFTNNDMRDQGCVGGWIDIPSDAHLSVKLPYIYPDEHPPRYARFEWADPTTGHGVLLTTDRAGTLLLGGLRRGMGVNAIIDLPHRLVYGRHHMTRRAVEV